MVSPYGDTLAGLVPFIGVTDAGNVDYRQRLFDASVLVIRQNPWFGGGNYIGELAALGMVQGEGIVDLVNTYLAVALSQGLVGLGLFVGVFAAAGLGLFVAWLRVGVDSELHRLGRAMLAALAAVLTMITTMSPILCVPTMYWLVAGLCVAFARLAGSAVLIGAPGVAQRHPHGAIAPA